MSLVRAKGLGRVGVAAPARTGRAALETQLTRCVRLIAVAKASVGARWRLSKWQGAFAAEVIRAARIPPKRYPSAVPIGTPNE